MIEASRTRPGRTNRRYRPSRIAIGIVIASVNVAHGEDLSAVYHDETDNGEKKSS